MDLAPDKDQQTTSISVPTPGSSSEPVQKSATGQNESDNSQEKGKYSSENKQTHKGLIQGLDGSSAESQQKSSSPLPDPTNLNTQLNGSSTPDASGSPESHIDQHSPRSDTCNSLPHKSQSQSNSNSPLTIFTTVQTPGAALNAFLTRNMPSRLHDLTTSQTLLDSTPSHQEAHFTPPPPPTADGSQSSSIPPSNNSPYHSPSPPLSNNGTSVQNEQAVDGYPMLVDGEKKPKVRKSEALEKSPEQSNGPSTRLRPRNKRPPEPKAKEPPKRPRTNVARTIRSAAETSSPAGSSSPSWIHPADMNSTKSPQDVEMQDSRSVEAGSLKTLELESNDNSSPVYTESSPEQATNGSTNDNPNLDPALTSQSSSNRTTDAPTLNNANRSAKVPTSNPNDKKSTSLPQSPLANNPYLSLSTVYTKSNAGSPTYNPYALYYGPGAPLPSHTPPYPYPYYYLPSPIAGSSVYPANHSFVPPNTNTQQKIQQSDGQKPKPKRLKAHTVTTGNHNIPVVPRDKNGKPMLPLNVGIMTVIQLGEVCMREHFHTERYIFPVGYEVTRRYLSTLDPNIEVVYHCTILDGGDGPKFQIVPSDAPQRTVIAGTATGAWSNIVKQANAIRNRQHSNSVSGPDFFGLGQNTIKHLIQQLPNANRLRDYVWQNFVEGGPLGGRHAAVTPALPEDYDSTLSIGALYPNERDRLKRDISSSPGGLNHYPPHIVAHVEGQRQVMGLSNGHRHSAQVPPIPQPHHLSTSAPPVSQITNGQGIPTSTPNEQLQSVPAQEHVHNQAGSAAVPTTIASLMNAYPVPANTSAPS